MKFIFWLLAIACFLASVNVVDAKTIGEILKSFSFIFLGIFWVEMAIT